MQTIKTLPFLCFGITNNKPLWIWPIRENLYIAYAIVDITLTNELIPHRFATEMSGQINNLCPNYRSYYANYLHINENYRAFVLELEIGENKLTELHKQGIAAVEYEDTEIKEISFL